MIDIYCYTLTYIVIVKNVALINLQKLVEVSVVIRCLLQNYKQNKFNDFSWFSIFHAIRFTPLKVRSSLFIFYDIRSILRVCTCSLYL